jgi:hypothetical protein
VFVLTYWTYNEESQRQAAEEAKYLGEFLRDALEERRLIPANLRDPAYSIQYYSSAADLYMDHTQFKDVLEARLKQQPLVSARVQRLVCLDEHLVDDLKNNNIISYSKRLAAGETVNISVLLASHIGLCDGPDPGSNDYLENIIDFEKD